MSAHDYRRCLAALRDVHTPTPPGLRCALALLWLLIVGALAMLAYVLRAGGMMP